MPEPTRYRIESIADLMAVPDEHFEGCIEEVTHAIRAAREYLALVRAIASDVAGEDVPEPASLTHVWWAPDGTRDVLITHSKPDAPDGHERLKRIFTEGRSAARRKQQAEGVYSDQPCVNCGQEWMENEPGQDGRIYCSLCLDRGRDER